MYRIYAMFNVLNDEHFQDIDLDSLHVFYANTRSQIGSGDTMPMGTTLYLIVHQVAVLYIAAPCTSMRNLMQFLIKYF